VTREELLSRTRERRQVALARQVALYLLHTVFSQAYTDVGRLFGRERTTVAYACAAVEDERDNFTFDMKIESLEDCAERLWAIETLRHRRFVMGGIGSRAAA
jgi:chromosomal replication initiation ATPase DnaA